MEKIPHLDPPTPETPICRNVLHEIADLGLNISAVHLSFSPSVNLNRSINPLHECPTGEEADSACATYQLCNLAFEYRSNSPVKMKKRKLINRLYPT